MERTRNVTTASSKSRKWPCPLCEHLCASEASARWHCLKKRATGQRGSKFGAQRTPVDSVTFDSKREAARYLELRNLERAGKVHHLELQPKFDCLVKGTHVCTYIADFRYVDDEGFHVIEDAKGYKTAAYRLKKKLVEALFYPLKIQEV